MNRPNLWTSDHAQAAAVPHFGKAVALTSVSTLVAMLAYAGPLGNAPTLTTSLSASTAGRTWILSSMSVGLAVSLLSVGALADDFGRRRVFAVGAWVFVAGSAVCAVANGSTLFVAGRLVEGAGAAGVVATGLGLVAAATGHAAQHDARRAAAASWWGASMGAGIALGPVLTGLLDLGGQWRLFYWLLVAAGTAIAVAAPRWFTESETTAARRVDVAGLATMTGGLGLLLVALTAVRRGEENLAVVGGVLAVVLLAGFVATQLQGRAPMLDPALFRRTDFLAATIAALATGSGVIALMSFAGTFLVTAMGMTTLGAGGMLAIWSATSAAAAIAGRRLPGRLAGNGELVTGLAGVGSGMLLLTALSTASTPWRLVPGLLLAGVASGILNAGLGRQAVASAPRERAALGTGTNNTARYVGSSIGVTIVSVIAADPTGTRAGLVTGWNHAAAVTAAVSLAGALTVGVLARSRTHQRPPERNDR